MPADRPPEGSPADTAGGHRLAALFERDHGPARLRDVMMPVFFKRFAEKGGAWMYDYDVEWNAVSAPASAST